MTGYVWGKGWRRGLAKKVSGLVLAMGFVWALLGNANVYAGERASKAASAHPSLAQSARKPTVSPISDRAIWKRPAWLDPNTGLAVGGFDPVAYRTQQRAVRGRPNWEYVWRGQHWRFRNQGNRDAFAAHPQIYAPMFGGHDPRALAQGRVLPGHPRIWVAHDGEIYLFHNAVSKYLWLEQVATLLPKARSAWRRLRRDIHPLPELPGLAE